MQTYDLLVIGAGPGGYPAAIRAAQLGASVALVERELPGGTCLNWGCIPTKTLITAADLFGKIQQAERFGIRVGAPDIDYAAAGARKNEVVAKLRNGVAQLLKSNGVRWIEGTAAFLARNRIAVGAGSGATQLEAARVIIATGSTSALPAFLPRHPRILESRGFLDLTALPASLIVLGGGVIGCEFACLAARFGVQVTVVELLEDILIMLDADVRRELRRHMEQDLNIRVLTGNPLVDVQADDAGVRGTVDNEKLAAELMLVAIGRRPVTADLRLEAAGLAVDKAGYIPVNEYGETGAATIYAVGDVNGGPQLAHAATAQGIAVAETVCRKARRTFDPLTPNCIFTIPEIGSVGLTEAQAQERGIAVKTGKFPFGSLGKALASGEPAGFVKWVADAATDRLLGAQAIGPHATELIAEATLAVKGEYTAAEFGRVIHCHPTLAEMWLEAAHAVHGECIHAAPKRRA
jgi:dihydrolipoamide dehydrogenase